MCYFVVSADAMDPKLLGKVDGGYFGEAVNELMDQIHQGKYPHNVLLIPAWEMGESQTPIADHPSD